MGFNLDRRMYDLLGCMPTIPGAVGAFRRKALLQGRRHERGHARRGHRHHDGRLHRDGWRVVYEEHARAWTEAPDHAPAAVVPALPLVLRHHAGDVEAPRRDLQVRSRGPLRPGRPAHLAIFQVLRPRSPR